MLSNNELLRYAKHLGIESWGKSVQENLKKSRVFVAGAGGLGSPLLYYLAGAGIGNLVVCDFDTIEITNLNRQILHNNHRIGERKADSALRSLQDFNPDISVSCIRDPLTKANADSFISGSDLIVDCLDNIHARHILNTVSVSRFIPMIHAGVSEFSGQITFLHPPETACLACFFPDEDKDGIFYVAGATAGVMGSLQAMEAMKYLTGIGENLKNRILFWDGASMRFETIVLNRNPHCSICGKHSEKGEPEIARI